MNLINYSNMCKILINMLLWMKILLKEGFIIIKKYIFIITSTLLIMGCQSVNSSSTTDNTFDLSEDEEKKLSELPLEIKEEIIVPTTFPSEPDNIHITIHRNPSNEEEIMYTEFTFVSRANNWTAHLQTWHVDTSIDTENSLNSITLENGNEAILLKDTNPKLMEWVNSQGNVQTLSFIEDNESSNYTVDDFIDIANSTKKLEYSY
ncbi:MULTISPECIES: hypothetical protein [Allobacillus]|uniref:DUF4367 domain-containing protein n=1 Tax=Allobacillus salarius TaxID=1955272 RepID=A0A556PPB3_9BACI|nr:hypothetical protein [Allobacillus salarius]TSJ66225.1 hypothetical protein FPQ13_04970 [Allobacillus salarius]